MNDLVQALTIFLKYQTDNPRCPTHCEHDVLYIMDVTWEQVSEEDRSRLTELGFLWLENEGSWVSFRFGSA